MKNKLIKATSICVAIVLCAAFSGNENVQKSGGAPVRVTNAPGEQTCSGMEGGKSGHSGGIPDNSGPGTTAITFSGGSTYVPGQTYTITATINHPLRNRFGFQIVSLKDSDSSFTGTITLTDSTRMQTVQPTSGSFLDRIYVTHRLAGTYTSVNNVGQWSYTWTAPTYNAGNISFYAAYLAANNNNDNDPGDETYWKKITIAPTNIGIAETAATVHLAIYPNPCTEYVYLSYYLFENTPVKAELISLDGKVVQTLVDEKIASGSYTEKIKLQDITAGVYLIKSTTGKNEKFSRLYIQ